ncbi:MAG: Rieske (2Fe-2S) protein [Nevskiales bacterium]
MKRFQMMQKLCNLADIPEGGSKRLAFKGDRFGHGLCVVKRDGVVRAYLNRCPHTQAPMDWMPGRFLTRDGELIQCSVHGARFRIDNGYCVSGPCAGQSLQKLPIVCENGQLWLPDIP